VPIYMAPLKLVNPKIDVSLNRKFLTAASSETCVNCWMWGVTVDRRRGGRVNGGAGGG
jgi:hypothetical protein